MWGINLGCESEIEDNGKEDHTDGGIIIGILKA